MSARDLRDVVIEDSTFTGGRSGSGPLKFYGSSVGGTGTSPPSSGIYG